MAPAAHVPQRLVRRWVDVVHDILAARDQRAPEVVGLHLLLTRLAGVAALRTALASAAGLLHV